MDTNEEILLSKRESMTEEEIQKFMEQEEEELSKLMMGFSAEMSLSKPTHQVVEEDEEEDIIKILPDGSIISEVKQAEENAETGSVGLDVDPLLLVFGARLKIEVLKEFRADAYWLKNDIEKTMQGPNSNRWMKKHLNPALEEVESRIKELNEEIRLSTGFSDDVEDVVERGSKRIQDKTLEMEVMRRMDEKIEELLSLTSKSYVFDK